MNGVREYRRLESVQNANLHIGIKGVKAIPLTQGMFAIVDEVLTAYENPTKSKEIG